MILSQKSGYQYQSIASVQITILHYSWGPAIVFSPKQHWERILPAIIYKREITKSIWWVFLLLEEKKIENIIWILKSELQVLVFGFYKLHFPLQRILPNHPSFEKVKPEETYATVKFWMWWPRTGHISFKIHNQE